MGSSSEDIRLSDTYKVMKDGVVEGKTRGFYAKAEEQQIKICEREDKL